MSARQGLNETNEQYRARLNPPPVVPAPPAVEAAPEPVVDVVAPPAKRRTSAKPAAKAPRQNVKAKVKRVVTARPRKAAAKKR